MKRTRLGSTGVEVSAMGLGAMPLSIAGRPPEGEGIAVIHRALDRGVTLFDTADAYCRDESEKHHNERLIAKALASYPGEVRGVIVATKGGLMRPGGAWTNNSDPDHLRRTIRESHEALGGGGPIPLWQHHAPDPAVPLAKSLAPVREAVDEGLIRWVGVSNYSVEQIETAREFVEVISVQNQYNPWHRRPEEDGVLAYCEREGMSFLPWSPLGGGGRVGRLGEFPELVRMAEEKGVSLQQLVLAWLRAKSPSVIPIPGASRIASLEDSLAALDLELGAEEVERLDQSW